MAANRRRRQGENEIGEHEKERRKGAKKGARVEFTNSGNSVYCAEMGRSLASCRAMPGLREPPWGDGSVFQLEGVGKHEVSIVLGHGETDDILECFHQHGSSTFVNWYSRSLSLFISGPASWHLEMLVASTFWSRFFVRHN